MKPAFKAFSYRSDTTPRLAVRLFSENVHTQAIRHRPGIGDVVEWKIGWPSGTTTRSTAANGGLLLDAVTGVVDYPITAGDIAALAIDVPVPFVVSVVNSDGKRWPFLDGTITREKAPL